MAKRQDLCVVLVTGRQQPAKPREQQPCERRKRFHRPATVPTNPAKAPEITGQTDVRHPQDVPHRAHASFASASSADDASARSGSSAGQSGARSMMSEATSEVHPVW